MHLERGVVRYKSPMWRQNHLKEDCALDPRNIITYDYE